MKTATLKTTDLVDTTEAANLPPSDRPTSPPGANKLRAILLHPLLHIGILAALVSICFARTLSSYFLADDIGQIKYVSEILSGRLDLLWSNFTGNYMQIAGMSVYRPMLLLTLLFDCFLYHSNAVGYYATNLLYFFGDVVLVYAVARLLTNRWEKWRSCIAAFLAAVLFAVSPLHCESVSWVVGRVDVACCFFYLASLSAFLRATGTTDDTGRVVPQRIWTLVGVLLFVLGITVKEMAIGLPVILSGLGFFRPADSASSNMSFKQRLQAAWHASRTLWIATACYFAVRFLTLGTILGGYTGSIGATQSENAISRWLDGDTLHRFFFPFAHDVFSNPSLYTTCLTASYSLIAALLGFKLLSGKMPWRLFLFFALWCLSTLAPIYKLWGLGYNLEGARFCFFVSAAFSIMLPTVLFSPDSVVPEPVQKRLNALSALALLIIALVFAKTTYATNLAWIHAGKEVRSVGASAVELTEQVPANKKMILLGVPKEHVGAHMILNGDTLKMLLGRPLMKKEYWPRFLTFDPMLFGPEQYVNATRLRKQLADPQVQQNVFVWSSEGKRFSPVSFGPYEKNSQVSFEIPVSATAIPCTEGHARYEFKDQVVLANSVVALDGLRLTGLNVSPLNFDFLELEYKNKGKLPLKFAVRWNGDRADKSYQHEIAQNCAAYKELPPSLDQWSTGRIRLSRYWRWFASPRVSELRLLFPPQDELDVRNLKLIDGSCIVPSINVLNAEEDSVGCYRVTKDLKIAVDAQNVAGTDSISLEISKFNYFFDNYEEGRDQSAIEKTELLKSNTAQLMVPVRDFQPGGFYQLRVRALNQHGQPIGEYSDPITLSASR